MTQHKALKTDSRRFTLTYQGKVVLSMVPYGVAEAKRKVLSRVSHKTGKFEITQQKP